MRAQREEREKERGPISESNVRATWNTWIGEMHSPQRGVKQVAVTFGWWIMSNFSSHLSAPWIWNIFQALIFDCNDKKWSSRTRLCNSWKKSVMTSQLSPRLIQLKGWTQRWPRGDACLPPAMTPKGPQRKYSHRVNYICDTYERLNGKLKAAPTAITPDTSTVRPTVI